jgi:alginate O-acetyltransferase complex protein AlgJ
MSRNHKIRLGFALLAIAFFATPIAARMIGITAESFENRPFATAPKPSQGWDAFAQTTQFLVDRMPLRKQAVEANTRIWTDVFNTTPRYGGPQQAAAEGPLPAGAPADDGQLSRAEEAAQVLRGRDGWLFVHAELNASCAPPLPLPAALAQWRRLLTAIRSERTRAVLVVAPDKGTIYPERLPDLPEGACVEAGKRKLWELLERVERPEGLMALRDDLRRLKRGAGDDLYARKDSHWTTVGSLALTRAVVEGLGNGRVAVRPGDVEDPGPTEYTGDLTNLLGAPETDMQEQRTIARDRDAPRIPGRTLLIGDSYSQGPVPQLVHYFEDLRILTWQAPAPELARGIRAADTVVLETVEREFAFRAATVVGQVEQQLSR